MYRILKYLEWISNSDRGDFCVPLVYVIEIYKIGVRVYLCAE